MKYAIGIDLGTTNSELAYCSLDDVNAIPKTLEIPQFVAPSVIEKRPLLPSSLYIGPEEERTQADWKLPWENLNELAADLSGDVDKQENSPSVQPPKRNFFQRFLGLGTGTKENVKAKGVSNPNALYLVGEIASSRAAISPEQTVSSAKSWLTYPRVDRRSCILPWKAPEGLPKVSPVEASRRYLAHLISAWNAAFPEEPIFEQQVALTVPASFDESARELTREAAVEAGLNPETFVFLEEPQAALYAWLAQKGADWRKELTVGDVILVCDVGGGTTDLSLIQVCEDNGNLVLERLAVGNRLLLGGDNMDLALAYRATELFKQQGTELNPWQSVALQRSCRGAKERLLLADDAANDSVKIAVMGRSSRMIADSMSVDFPKKDAEDIVLNGFFPLCSLDDRPKSRSGLGVREIGLPYEVDVAVTRHVAKFLNSQKDDAGSVVAPTCFLLNGGIFKSKLLEDRFQTQLQKWFPDRAPRNLHPAADLEQAVSNGAAYYAAVKHNGGMRIRAASARSYYIGIESAGLAIPGVSRPLKALCVAPCGMEEGEERVVPSEDFELVVGEAALFRFFSSTLRPQDRPGATLDWFENDENSELQETAPIETVLNDDDSSSSQAEGGDDVANNVQYVTVRFRSVITELGALEIWCEEKNGPRRWKLEFSVRED